MRPTSQKELPNSALNTVLCRACILLAQNSFSYVFMMYTLMNFWAYTHYVDILAHNIAIKRYCDKDIFHQIFFFLCVLNFMDNSVLQISLETTVCIEKYHWCLWFEKISKRNNNILRKKFFFYHNVFLSFYCNIVCKNI